MQKCVTMSYKNKNKTKYYKSITKVLEADTCNLSACLPTRAERAHAFCTADNFSNKQRRPKIGEKFGVRVQPKRARFL